MRWGLFAAKRTCWTLCVCIAQLLLANAAVAQNVAIVLSENTKAYLEFADAIKQVSGQRGATSVKFIVLSADDIEAGAREIYKTDFYRVILTIGARAASKVADLEVKPPVLNALIPRSLYRRLPVRQGGEASSAIYLDQPYARQLALIRLLLPGKTRIGVVYGPNSADAWAEFEGIAKDNGFSVVAEKLERISDIGPLFERVFARSDCLLMLPDADIYNRASIPRILLSSYHANRPVVSFSAAHVKSGALAAIFSSPELLAQQIAAVLIKPRINDTIVLPPPQYPLYWRVSVNRQVARSLKVNVANDNELQRALIQIKEEVQ